MGRQPEVREVEVVELRCLRCCRLFLVEGDDVVLDRGKAARNSAPDDESERENKDNPVAAPTMASARPWVAA
jgi:hypothetical protein